MLRSVYILTFLLFRAVLFAQPLLTNENHKTIVVTDTTNHINLAANITCYPDEHNRIKNFGELDSVNFIPFKGSSFRHLTNMGYINVWLKFTIENLNRKPKKAIFFCGHHGLIRVLSVQGSHKTNEAGFLSNPPGQQNLEPGYGVNIDITADSLQQFFVQVSNYYKLNDDITPQIFFQNNYYLKEAQDIKDKKPGYFIQFLLLGGILIMCLFNIAQFLVQKNKAYLYYACYAFAIFIFVERSLEYNTDFRLLSQFFPLYFYRTVNYYTVAGGVFYTLFVRHFVNSKELYRNTHKISSFLLWLYLFSILCILLKDLFFMESTMFNWLSTFVAFLPFFGGICINITLLPYFLKQPLVRYIVIGSSFLIAGGLIQVYLNNYTGNFNSLLYPPVIYLEAGILCELFFFALGLGYKRKILEKEKQALGYKKLLIEMQSLRGQMDPHFIFNCLNSIQLYTMENNIAAASEYIGKFSKLIRNSLNNSRASSVTLASELEAIKLYIELEAMRFKNKLRYRLEIDPNLDIDYIELPPLLLQPYIENAIWHGLMPKAEGGSIIMAIDEDLQHNLLVIKISDDGIGRTAAAIIKNRKKEQHESIGTKLTEERIALINEKYEVHKAIVEIIDLYKNNEPAGTQVTIKLPI